MAESENDKEIEKPVYMLRPDGSLKEVTKNASILRSLADSYKIDSKLFTDALDDAITDLRKELEEEIDGSETD